MLPSYSHSILILEPTTTVQSILAQTYLELIRAGAWTAQCGFSRSKPQHDVHKEGSSNPAHMLSISLERDQQAN
jgi:hypothetical protein